MTSPAISVLMPVYNGEKHLAEAVDSILAQTFADFEFIIVDDASTDATAALLADYARRDSRIRILTNESNSKIAFSLNRGLAEARAPLIARMDADDWSHPERFAKQYAFMKSHSEIAVCGTWLEVYDSGEVWPWPCGDADIRARMLFDSSLAHPTVVFRKQIVESLAEGYDVTTPPAEDYDLWARLAVHAEVRFANLPEVLLRYRTYPEKNRAAYREQQKVAADRARMRLLRSFGLSPSEKEVACHLALGGAETPTTVRELWGCWLWGRKLVAYNAQAGIYEHAALHCFARKAWHNLAHRHPVVGALRKLWVTYAPQGLRQKYRVWKKRYMTHGMSAE